MVKKAKIKKPTRRHRKGTVYVNNLQQTLEFLRLKYQVTYVMMSKETGIPIMTLWGLGNGSALNVASPTQRKNYDRILEMVEGRIGGRHQLRVYSSVEEARKNMGKQYRRLTMSVKDDVEIEEFRMDDRVQLKAVRTALNEYCNRTQDDSDYFFVYSNDSEQKISDNLKAAVQKEMDKDPTWITKAPDIIILFADAAGLLPDASMPEEEPDEEVDEDLDDVDDPEYTDEDEDKVVEIDDEEAGTIIHAPEPEDEVEEVVEMEDDNEDEPIVYRIELDSEPTTGMYSKLFQEIANGLNNPEADIIEIVKRKEVGKAVKVVVKKEEDSLSVEGLRKRMKVGGDLLNRTKRIEFIQEHKIPVKKNLTTMAPKDLTEVIINWAEKR